MTSIVNNNDIPLSLTQGIKFKKYQDKKIKSLEKSIENVNSVEGFTGDLQLSDNGLTNQSNQIIKSNDFSSSQQTISNLKAHYQSTLTDYGNLVAKINGSSTSYLDRINPNNPYLGKVIQLQGGALFYVTNQGVAKNIPSMDVYTQVSGKNGFPPQGQLTPVSISWDNSYGSPGVTIPTTPPLITGTPVTIGQSVGNEGTNVFVNTMLNNPQSSYVGCYNNLPPSTEIMFVPKMNSSNSVNGYNTYASSVYNNDNNFTGPWNAFDQNIDTWWHSGVSSSNNLYNSITGQYTGTTQVPFTNSSGVQTTVSGEWLQLNLPGVGTSNATTFSLTRYEIQGRQGCCGNPNGRDPNTWYILGWTGSGWQQVDYQSNATFNFKMLSFNVSNPIPCSAYLIIITVTGSNAGNAGDRSCVQIATWNLYTSSNPVSNPQSAMTNAGKMNFAQCQSYAVNTGNQYFGLQSVDSNGNGNCMVSNDLAGSQMYGTGVNYTTTALWSSNTTGNNPGSTASLTISGTLSVLNSSGAAIFSSPNGTTPPSNYIGCYSDRSSRAMTAYNSGKRPYTNATCQQAAESIGATYYGLQDSNTGTNAQCFTSSNLSNSKKYGIAKNCTQISDGSWSGGGWSNALYQTSTPSTDYFLILQDDGNLCVYKGSPSDNQGGIWCSMTNGQQQQPNTNFAASNGKFGQNWISTGSTLSPGDFIGSTDGSIYLIMQSDGNLVLNTSTPSSKCTGYGGKTVGAQDTNALYQLAAMGDKASIGKLAYIDQDSQSHSYPSNNINFSNSYTNYTGINSGGNDIPGAAYGNATVEQCQTSCNNNPDCAGFAFGYGGCYPKTSSMFPNGPSNVDQNVNLYTRNKAPISPPIGVPGTVTNVDTIMYDNYTDGGALSTSYGLTNATSTQKQELDQLQTKLNLLSSGINNFTNKFDSGSATAITQTKKNVNGIKDYLQGINSTNNKIVNFNTNAENMLNDSDITVLKHNYDYLFWSILATGTVLLSMNILKKQQ
jgi:hypothetical protein